MGQHFPVRMNILHWVIPTPCIPIPDPWANYSVKDPRHRTKAVNQSPESFSPIFAILLIYIKPKLHGNEKLPLYIYSRSMYDIQVSSESFSLFSNVFCANPISQSWTFHCLSPHRSQSFFWNLIELLGQELKAPENSPRSHINSIN